jgi:hypothetical protein
VTTAGSVQVLLDGGPPVLSEDSVVLMTRNHIGHLTTAFGFKYGLSVGIATHDARGGSPLPVGGFGWYGIYSTLVLDAAPDSAPPCCCSAMF